MFTQSAIRRTRKRNPVRKIRGLLELLETRRLMAGDLNMGSYVISSRGDFQGTMPPAITQSLETAGVTATFAPPKASSADPKGVDIVLTGEQLWLSPLFLPRCPAVKIDNTAADATFIESGDSEAKPIGPFQPAAPTQTIGTLSGMHGSRDRTAASPRAANENRLIFPLSATVIQSKNFVAVPDTSGGALEDKTAGEELHYFTADGSQPATDGPSLANQSLSPYVQSDTFMAMGLLPSPLTSDPNDDSSFASQSESHSYQSRSDFFDGWIDGQDLDSLREDASANNVDELVAPLPFLGVSMHSFSAAMDSVVTMDFYGLDSESLATDDASLLAKLDNNRYQFAAFAFVFTIVTVRMNSNDSKRE